MTYELDAPEPRRHAPIRGIPANAPRLLRQYGCVQVTQAFHPLEIANAKQNLDTAYDLIGGLPESEQPPFTRDQGIVQPEDLGAYGAAIADWIESFIRGTSIFSTIEAWANGPVVAHRPSIRVRRHTPGRAGSHVPWHQDAMFLDPDTPYLNCWAPLTECGVDAPALDLIPIRPTFTFATAIGDGRSGYGMGGISTADLSAKFGDYEIWTPTLALGDCLLFESNCVHRTSQRSTDAQPRMSFEIRFYPAPR